MSRRYWQHYHALRMKRFLFQSGLLFGFQCLILLNLGKSPMLLPLNPLLGLAFTAFFLLGNTALFGLILADVFIYFLSDVGHAFAGYMLIDLLGGYIGAELCQKILTSDLRPFANWHDSVSFFKTFVLLICPVTALFRLIDFLFLQENQQIYQSFMVNFNLYSIIDKVCLLFLYFLNLMISDLNAIIVFSGFVFSWAYLSYSRERIKPFALPAFILVTVLLYLLMKDYFLLFIAFSIINAFIWAYFFDYPIATAIMFLSSVAFFLYFQRFNGSMLGVKGQAFNTICFLGLLFYAITIQWLGYFRDKKLTKSLNIGLSY